MMPASVLVQATTRDLTPGSMRLPPIAWSAFTALNRVHGVWRWYRRIELYRNPDNFSQLLAGHAVNLVVGDYLLVRIAAQCLLISTRILECVEQQISLYREGCIWIHAVKGHYPFPNKVKWDEGKEIAWLSPSTVIGLKAFSLRLYEQLKRIVYITCKIFKKTFQLSMKTMDAIDAFSLSPASRNEGINEIFVNTLKWLDSVVENKDQLIQGVANNKEIIERILIGSPFKYEQLYSAVSRTLDQTESIYQRAKGVSQFGNGIIVDFGKRALNSGMVVAGVANLRPAFLAHPVHSNFEWKSDPNGQMANYPPRMITDL